MTCDLRSAPLLVAALATLSACEPFDRIALPHPQPDGMMIFVAASPDDVWWFHDSMTPDHPFHHWDGSSWVDVAPTDPRGRGRKWGVAMEGARLANYDDQGYFLVARDGGTTDLGHPLALEAGDVATYQAASLGSKLFVAASVSLAAGGVRNSFHVHDSGKWTELAPPPHQLDQLEVIADDEIWALMTPAGANQVTELVRFDGKSWNTLPSPPAINTPYTVANRNLAWQVTGAGASDAGIGVQLAEWNGTEWRNRTFTFPAGSEGRLTPQFPVPYGEGLALVGLRQFLPGNAAEQVTELIYMVPEGDAAETSLGEPKVLATLQDTCDPFCVERFLRFYGQFTREAVVVADGEAMWVGRLDD